MSSNNLDSQWQQYTDEGTGLPYLYNSMTGESRWIEEERAVDTESILNAWETYQDERGNEFYYNKITGVSSWENPFTAAPNNDNPLSPVSWRSHQSVSPSYRGNVSNRSQEVKTNPWQKYYDDDGNEFYYNHETGESSWTPPDDATSPVVSKSWATFYDDDGNIFYYNHETGASSWEKPSSARSVTSIGNNSVVEDRKPPPISRIPSMVSLGSFRSQSHNEVGLALVRPPSTGQPLSRNNSISSLTSLLITSNGRRANPSARMPPTANLTQNRSPSISENPSADPNSNSAIIKHVLNSVAQVTVSKPPPRLASIGSLYKLVSRPPGSLPEPRAIVNSYNEQTRQMIGAQSSKASSAAKNPFDRMKEGATVSNTFTIGQVVWQEWQAEDDGPTFYAKKDCDGGQWDKPMDPLSVLGGSLSASSKNLEVPKDGSLFNPAISGSGSFQSKKVEITSGKDNPPIMTKSSSSVSKSGKNAYLGSALDSDIKSLGAVEVDDVSISSSHSSSQSSSKFMMSVPARKELTQSSNNLRIAIPALPIEESLKSMKSSGKKNSRSLQKTSLDSSSISKKSQPNLSSNSLLMKSNPSLTLNLSTTKPPPRPTSSNSTSNSNINVQNVSQVNMNPNLSPSPMNTLSSSSFVGQKYSQPLENKSSHGSIPVIAVSAAPVQPQSNAVDQTAPVHSFGEKSLPQNSLSNDIGSTLPPIHNLFASTSSLQFSVMDGQSQLLDSYLPLQGGSLLSQLQTQSMAQDITVVSIPLPEQLRVGNSSILSTYSQLHLSSRTSLNEKSGVEIDKVPLKENSDGSLKNATGLTALLPTDSHLIHAVVTSVALEAPMQAVVYNNTAIPAALPASSTSLVDTAVGPFPLHTSSDIGQQRSDEALQTKASKASSKNPFDRMKDEAAVVSTFQIGQVVWEEWQVDDDGPVFYAKKDCDGGQWDKPDHSMASSLHSSSGRSVHSRSWASKNESTKDVAVISAVAVADTSHTKNIAKIIDHKDNRPDLTSPTFNSSPRGEQIKSQATETAFEVQKNVVADIRKAEEEEEEEEEEEAKLKAKSSFTSSTHTIPMADPTANSNSDIARPSSIADANGSGNGNRSDWAPEHSSSTTMTMSITKSTARDERPLQGIEAAPAAETMLLENEDDLMCNLPSTMTAGDGSELKSEAAPLSVETSGRMIRKPSKQSLQITPKLSHGPSTDVSKSSPLLSPTESLLMALAGSESDHPSSLRETSRQRENIEAYLGPPLDENVGSHSDVAPQRSMLSAAGSLIESQNRVVGSALEDSFGGPAVVAALSARISDITLTANNSNFSESELWDIFFSGEAVVKEKQWPWVRLYHRSKKLTIFWNEQDNLIQAVPPGPLFAGSSVEGGDNKTASIAAENQAVSSEKPLVDDSKNEELDKGKSASASGEVKAVASLVLNEGENNHKQLSEPDTSRRAAAAALDKGRNRLGESAEMMTARLKKQLAAQRPQFAFIDDLVAAASIQPPPKIVSVPAPSQSNSRNENSKLSVASQSIEMSVSHNNSVHSYTETPTPIPTPTPYNNTTKDSDKKVVSITRNSSIASIATANERGAHYDKLDTKPFFEWKLKPSPPAAPPSRPNLVENNPKNSPMEKNKFSEQIVLEPVPSDIEGMDSTMVLREYLRLQKELRRKSLAEHAMSNDSDCKYLLQRLSDLANPNGSSGEEQETFSKMEEKTILGKVRKSTHKLYDLLKLLEVSCIEKKVNEIYLSCAAMTYSQQLQAVNCCLPDHRLTNALYCPRLVKFQRDIAANKKRILKSPTYTVEGSVDKLAKNYSELSKVRSDSAVWLIYTDKKSETAGAFSKCLFVNATNLCSQFQIPFELKCAADSFLFTTLKWSEIKLHERFQPAKLKSKNVKLMSDPLGGLVFYNGTMNQYSSNGIFFQRNLVPKPPSRTSSPLHKSANKDRGRTDDVLSYFSGAVTTYLPDSTVNTSPSHWSGFLYKDSEKDARSKAQDASKKSRLKGKHTHTSSASLLSLPQLDVQKLSNYDRLLNSLESNLDKLVINNANNNAGNNEADSLFLTAYMTPLNSSRPNLHVNQYSNADNADHFLPGSAFKASPDHHGEAKDDRTKKLRFEEEMEASTYIEYTEILNRVAVDPEDITVLLDLLVFFFFQGLGKECVTVIRRVMEIVESRFSALGIEDGDFYCVVHILSSKLAMRSFSYFERVSSIMTLAERFPSNPAVLAHAGEYFHCIRDFETAEKLYVGALLVNPHHDGALLGFAHFFADAAAQLNSWVRVTDVKNLEIQSIWQTHLSSAETFLKKIDSKSPYYLMAKVEIIWLQEIRRFHSLGEANNSKSVGPELNQNLNKNSNNTLLLRCKTLASELIGPGRKGQARMGSADRLASCLLHSLGFQYHCDVRPRGGGSGSGGSNVFSSKDAVECYERALTFDGENSQALILMAMLKNSICCHTLSSSSSSSDDKQYLINQIDANFRRGILVTSSDVCMGLASICYGDFLSLQLGDYCRAEQYYEDAVRALAGEESLWVCPIIALVSFYSNVIGDFNLAERLLTSTLRDRHHEQIQNHISNRSVHAFSDILSRQEEDHEVPVTQRGAYAALYVASAYYLLQRPRGDNDVPAAKHFISAALKIHKTNAAAWRCAALFEEHSNKMAIEFMTMSLACDSRNALSRQTLAILHIRSGNYRTALSVLQELVAHPNCNATLKVDSDSSPTPLSLLLVTVLLCNCNRDYTLALTYITAACNILEEKHRAHVGASVRYLQWNCVRVRGQLLLFCLGDVKEATRCFQAALRLLPWDALSLACMALCRQRLRMTENALTISMKQLRLRSAAKQQVAFKLRHPPLPFSQHGSVHGNLAHSATSPEKVRKSVAFSLERWEDVLHCSEPDLLMKAAVDVHLRQRLSDTGQGHIADPVGPLTYLLTAQYEMNKTHLPRGRMNAKNFLFRYINTSLSSERGATATLHPLVLYMAGLFLDDFLEARAAENADGDPIGSEKEGILPQDLDSSDKMYVAAISNAASHPTVFPVLIYCVEKNLDRLRKNIFRLQKSAGAPTVEVLREKKSGKRRSKRAKNHAGKKSTPTAIHSTSNGAFSGAVKVSTSASAPVLVDLLQRFASGHDRYGHDSHDDGDAISPVDRGDEEDGERQHLEDVNNCELMQLTCMYQRHQRVLDQLMMQRVRLGKTLKNFSPCEDDWSEQIFPFAQVTFDERDIWNEFLKEFCSQCDDWATMLHCIRDI